jgi:hypothetical protein
VLATSSGGYTAGDGLGQKARAFLKFTDLSMSRFLVVLIVILLVLVGGIVFLATRSTEKEPVRMEKVVPLDNLTN